jgi:hypothetical protein
LVWMRLRRTPWRDPVAFGSTPVLLGFGKRTGNRGFASVSLPKR